MTEKNLKELALKASEMAEVVPEDNYSFIASKELLNENPINISLDLDCFDKKVSKIIIVTGKGLHSQNDEDPYISKKFGILKNSVPDFIKNNSSLMKKIKTITDAEIEDGGSGAFYIFLKKKL